MSNQEDRKRRRNNDAHDLPSEFDTPADPSVLLPSSPVPFFSENDQHDIIEEDVIDDDFDERVQSDDDGIDLFGDNMEADYQENGSQDQYEAVGIDDDNYDPLDPTSRRQVDQLLNRRDIEIRKREGRVAGAFIDGLDDVDDAASPAPVRRRRHIYDTEAIDEDSEIPEMTLADIHNVKDASLDEWVNRESVRRSIKREFKDFLQTFTDEHSSSVYGERIRDMGERNGQSFEVSYVHLADKKTVLCYFLTNTPGAMLKIFDEAALEVTLMQFPEYENIHREIHVRITDLPHTHNLRDLRQSFLNTMIRVSGVVTRRTNVLPQLKWVMYNCAKCNALLGPFYQDIHSEIKINTCASCQSRGPFIPNMEKTLFRNYQKLTIQESPGTVPPGRIPRQLDVICLWDLVDQAKPGDEIEVIGIYRNNFNTSLTVKNGFPVFATVLEANHINKKENMFAVYKLTEDDKKEILALSKDKNIGKRIMKSIAPSIYGHEDIKRAIALAMFGGVPKNIKGKHMIRGDINVLMLGDPGTAKSQFLKYVEKTAHRSVYTTGQGASAVGLTASVHKDPVTREWTLEGGALVLADRGVCLIDEFDKMNDADRTSIHEAMEQQSISISKAGIVTTLQARCCVIAAANPIGGRYNSSVPFSQNVELTEPIISRFDVLCVVKDLVDADLDFALAINVIGSHIRSHPLQNGDTQYAQPTEVDADIIDQNLLRKYIMYAREMIHPKLHQVDEDKLSKLYSELRKASITSASIPITVRHLESMIRLAEAHAKMHLREYVRSEDVDVAIKVALDSFISAQKYNMTKKLRRKFRKYISNLRGQDEQLLAILESIFKDKLRLHNLKHDTFPESLEIKITEFEARAKREDIHDIHRFVESNTFGQHNFTLDPVNGKIFKHYVQAQQ